MQPEATNKNWNEIQFVSWGEFKQMAPSIIQLEIDRLSRLIGALPVDTEFYNNLVRARFALEQFVVDLQRSGRENAEKNCAAHIQTAIMTVSLQPEDLDAQKKKTCSYILDRLKYLDYRIRLIY